MNKEKSFTEEIECVICKNHVNMEVVKNVLVEQIHIPNLSPEPDDVTNDHYWQIIKCPACHKLLLRDGWWNELWDDETGPEYKVIYPSQYKRIEALPKDIEKAYEAAEKVKLIDSNAFAVLLGRVLDKVLLDKNATGDTLNEKLNDLAQKGLIPKTIVDAAHGIRKLRNIGAHADLGELTDQEIPILEDITNVILEYLYSAPEMIVQVTKKIAKLTKKGT